MTTVISPRLRMFLGDLGTNAQEYFCISGLEKFVEIPEAKYYWVEASDKQFPERNGIAIEVRFIDGELECLDGRVWRNLYFAIRIYVEKFGCFANGPPKKIYFRLWYQE
ncbi:MAG TPA: hypothetical protein ENI23_09285 [bacterium]|nr:hypothetical protein [bacterium]